MDSAQHISIKENTEERKVIGLDRKLPNRQTQQRFVGLFGDHVPVSLKHHIASGGPVVATRPLTKSKDFGSLETVAQMRSDIFERLNGVASQRIRELEITLPFGTRVLGTPYDEEWHKRGDSQWGTPGFNMDRFTGDVGTMFTGDGFAADAVGFYLSSTEPVLAVITPAGTYDFFWGSFENYPSLRSSGGVDITVYVDGKTQPLLSPRAVFWNLSGVRQFTSDKGTGTIADAASPAIPGLFTFTLAPLFLQMNPGSQYLVWVWCWQVNQGTKGTSFLSSVQLKMPFVTIDVRPPIIIR